MIQDYPNPFPEGDPDRRAIWEILVRRDINAFLAANWSIIEADFLPEEFVAYDAAGRSNPDHWRINFPTLKAYRDEYLRQAAEFTKVRLVGQTKVDFLHRTAVLRDIEIAGDRALAHKKFDGHAITETGAEVRLNWQSLFFLRKHQNRWRVTSFVGYLPNPMPQAAGGSLAPTITLPAEASQHTGAGPYSPVLRVSAGTLVAISGQGPIDPEGRIIGVTLQEQARHTLDNCHRVLAEAGATLHDVFKVTVYLADISEWDAFNQIYKQYFSPPHPVRTTVQAVLIGGIRVEIDMLAALQTGK
jgi:reactive intermediate/imine deaminase